MMAAMAQAAKEGGAVGIRANGVEDIAAIRRQVALPVIGIVKAEYPGRELTVMFGCTGGKGIDRREGMGNAAGQWADRIILTEDDPGPEEVEAICADIGVFVSAHGKDYTVIPNREMAVEQAILGSKRPAVVLLAGKGCETAQKRKNGPEPCIPDGQLAQRALDKYDAG